MVPSGENSFLKQKIRLSPWLLFPLFTLSNALLAYSDLPLRVKFWVGTAGLLLPLVAALWDAWEGRFSKKPQLPPTPPAAFPWERSLAGPPPWLWAVFLALLALTRSYRLTSFPFWPIGDEGIFSMIAMNLDRHWTWRLLHWQTQWEPLFTWLLALFFKACPPSLLSIRLFPGLISLAALGAGYWAARPLVGRWASFVLAWAMAFNFWSFTYSRMCVREGLLLVWMFLALGFLCRLWLERRGSWRIMGSLAFVLGTGFYVFTSWPLVVLGVVALVLRRMADYPDPRQRWTQGTLLLILTSALAAPMVMVRLSGEGAHHVRDLFWLPGALAQAGRYLTSLFWYGFHTAPWGPEWGGFFNPLLSSLVFLGLVETVRLDSKFLGVFLFAGFFLSLLPGALATGLSPYRISSLLPLALFLLVLGLRRLLTGLPSIPAYAFFLLFWASSMALDFHHYTGSYVKNQRCEEYSRAYGILASLPEGCRPLCLFSEFNIDYDDKTLELACYGFDALQGSQPRAQPHLAALIVHRDYQPFLQKRFPQSRWFLLAPQKDPGSYAYILGLLPLADMDPATLQKWVEADRVCRGINMSIKDMGPTSSWKPFLGSLFSSRERFEGDPFLVSAYWEKTAFFEILSGDDPGATDAYRKAFQQGYPAPHLYANLALTLKKMGKEEDARRAWEASLRAAAGPSWSGKLDPAPSRDR